MHTIIFYHFKEIILLGMLKSSFINLFLQTFLVWQLSFSFLLLGRKYSLNKIAGCLLVAAGVILAVKRFNNLFSTTPVTDCSCIYKRGLDHCFLHLNSACLLSLTSNIIEIRGLPPKKEES